MLATVASSDSVSRGGLEPFCDLEASCCVGVLGTVVAGRRGVLVRHASWLTVQLLRIGCTKFRRSGSWPLSLVSVLPAVHSRVWESPTTLFVLLPSDAKSGWTSLDC